MKIHFSRVIVKIDDVPNRTESGIYINIESSYITGEVVKISDDVVDVKIGDRILAKKSFGTDLLINKQKHRIFNLNQLLSVISKDAKIK